MPEHDAGMPADDARGGAVAHMHPIDAAVWLRLAWRGDQNMLRVVQLRMQQHVFEIIVGDTPQGNVTAHLHRFSRRPIQQGQQIVAVVVDGHQAQETPARIGMSVVLGEHIREDVQRTDDALVRHPIAGIKKLRALLHLQGDGDRAAGEVDDRETALAAVRCDGEYAVAARRNTYVIDRRGRAEDRRRGMGEPRGRREQRCEERSH